MRRGDLLDLIVLRSRRRWSFFIYHFLYTCLLYCIICGIGWSLMNTVIHWREKAISSGQFLTHLRHHTKTRGLLGSCRRSLTSYSHSQYCCRPDPRSHLTLAELAALQHCPHQSLLGRRPGTRGGVFWVDAPENQTPRFLWNSWACSSGLRPLWKMEASRAPRDRSPVRQTPCRELLVSLRVCPAPNLSH